MQCDPVQALYGIRHSEVVFGNSDMDNVSWDRFLVPSNSPTVHCHYLAIHHSPDVFEYLLGYVFQNLVL